MIYHLTLVGVLMSGFCSRVATAGNSTLHEAMKTGPFIKAGPMLPLTREKFEFMTFAAETYKAVGKGPSYCETESYCTNTFYDEDEYEYYESADEVDAVLMIDVGEYCFVTWRGTQSHMGFMSSAEDAFSNLDTDERVAESLDGQGQCRVLEGFYESYQGGECELPASMCNIMELLLFERHIISFVNTCMEQPNKQLVLTGHSQGGAASTVGAIRFAQYNPLAISIAGPPALQPGEDCTLLNPEHMWRIVNTQQVGDGDNAKIRYDLVPYLGVRWYTRFHVSKQVGPSIHLPPDIKQPDMQGVHDPVVFSQGQGLYDPVVFSQGQHNVAYFSENDIDLEETYGPSGTRLRVPYVHTSYFNKMYAMLEHASFPLDTSGYVPGTPCTGDADCQYICLDGFCSVEEEGLLHDGASCAFGYQCLSGECDYVSGSVTTSCTGGDADHASSPNDGHCTRHGNCQSGRCSGHTCVDKLEDGEVCQDDEDCVSGSCPRGLRFWRDKECRASSSAPFVSARLGSSAVQI